VLDRETLGTQDGSDSDTVTLQCHTISRYTRKCDVTWALISTDITVSAVPADRPLCDELHCNWSANVAAVRTNSFELTRTG